MRDSVLKRIDAEDLPTYVVWEPILKGDDERASRKAAGLLPADRVTSFWAGTKDVGLLFRKPIGLESEPAWDVYLVYPPGATWTGTDPPVPAFFMHQMRGRLPEDLMLDGGRLADEVRKLLARGTLGGE